MTSAKSNQKKLDRVQTQALRLITGGQKSTPIKAMEEVTNKTPLAKRRDAEALMQASISQYLPETKSHLKRSSYVHESKKTYQ